MAFRKKEFLEPPPSEEETILKDLAAVRKKKEDLEIYIGTDAWGPDDRVLLIQYNQEISRLEEKLADLKKAA